MKPRTATVFIDDVEWTAHFDYSPGYPACHTQRNGDPGWPEAPAEVVVNGITRTLPDGTVIEGTIRPQDENRLEIDCLESALQEDEERLYTYFESRDRRCE